MEGSGLRNRYLVLLWAVVIPFFGSALGTAPYAQQCAPPIKDHPYSAIFVWKRGNLSDAKMPMARHSFGSVRCGVPQPGESANPSEIIDVVRGEHIFFSRSVNSGPSL